MIAQARLYASSLTCHFHGMLLMATVLPLCNILYLRRFRSQASPLDELNN
jgi:hypothetical protein